MRHVLLSGSKKNLGLMALQGPASGSLWHASALSSITGSVVRTSHAALHSDSVLKLLAFPPQPP